MPSAEGAVATQEEIIMAAVAAMSGEEKAIEEVLSEDELVRAVLEQSARAERGVVFAPVRPRIARPLYTPHAADEHTRLWSGSSAR